MKSEIPIRVVSLQRIKHQKWYGKGKGDVVVCGSENYGWSKKIKCDECGKGCYYTPSDNPDLKIKNPKKICLDCALGLEKYKKFLNKEQIEILKRARK